jgi:hypothetical protein
MAESRSAATRSDVVAALEHAAHTLLEFRGDDDEIVVDAVLVIGVQSIDEDGDRCGRSMVFCRNGYQPPYITRGLLSAATDLVKIAVQED